MSHPVDDSTDPVALAKHQARVRGREARCALDAQMCQVAAQQLAQQLVALPELAVARTVLAYAATAEEIDPLPAVVRLRACGVDIAYPRIEAPGVLGVHLVDDESALVPAGFGLTEPSAQEPVCVLDAIDAVIVPGVAFDEGCWRLGYGGGYYDRLLVQLRRDCALVGIAFDEQVLERIPAHEHDVRLHAVVTPTRVIRPSRS